MKNETYYNAMGVHFIVFFLRKKWLAKPFGATIVVCAQNSLDRRALWCTGIFRSGAIDARPTEMRRLHSFSVYVWSYIFDISNWLENWWAIPMNLAWSLQRNFPLNLWKNGMRTWYRVVLLLEGIIPERFHLVHRILISGWNDSKTESCELGGLDLVQ